jgi:hypothetical protein
LIEAAVDLGTSVLDDLGTAAGLNLPSSVSIAAAQASAATPEAAVAGTSTYNTAMGSLTQTNLSISGAITSVGNELDPSTLFGAATASVGTASLNAMAVTTGTLCALTAAAGYAGRALVNLTNAST